VGQVDYLDPGVLQDPAHDIGGGVVTVEQRGGGDDSDIVAGLLNGDGCIHVRFLMGKQLSAVAGSFI
jgi:hypothetical protein